MKILNYSLLTIGSDDRCQASKRETRKTWMGRKSEGRKGNGGHSHFFLKASAKGLLVNRSGLLSFLSFTGSAFDSVFVPSFFP